jgi:hypothetical protein
VIDIPQDHILAQIAKVASEADETITVNQVAAVLAAYKAIHEGDPLGTIRKDPDTGAIAIRVTDNGLHLWRITPPDEPVYNDLQPTLPWPELG